MSEEKSTMSEEKTTPEANPAVEPGITIETPPIQFRDYEKELAELGDKLLRSKADYENLRRRGLKDLDDTRANARAATLEEFIGVHDTFRMAVAAAKMPNATLQNLLFGMDMIQSQFSKAFTDCGCTEIDALGKPFDHNWHEAVKEDHHDSIPAGQVIAVHRSGWRLGERLVRAASVVVSKGPAKAEPKD